MKTLATISLIFNAYLAYALGGLATDMQKANADNTHMLNRRLPELETAELVERGPTRPSSITGRNAATWRVKA